MLLIQKPVSVLGERRGMPDRIVGVEANNPAEQQVVIHLLNQHPLGSNPIDRLQQQGQQQLFRRDRGATALRVELA